MRQFIGMLCGIALAGLLAGILCACSGAPSSVPDNPETQEVSGTSAPEGAPPVSILKDGDASEDETADGEVSAPEVLPGGAEPGEPLPPATAENQARREAFAGLLRTVHDQQVLPDGFEVYGADIDSIEGNLFTVYDVNQDGKEELILLWQNAAMAGQVEIVYGYDGDSGELRCEVREFPGIVFYDNGTIECFWSHNQGLAGDFWPYNLYQYDAETGKYVCVGSVDAWDKSLRDTDYEGVPFPDSTDADGDGMIYYLLPPDWGGQYSAAKIVDGAEYLQWRNSYLEGADFLDLSFVTLTAQNIAQVLEVPYVELLDTLTPNPAG